MSSTCSSDDLRAISRDIHIPPAQWYTDTSVAYLAVQLLDICLKRNKVAELVDALSHQNPTLFTYPIFVQISGKDLPQRKDLLKEG